MLKDIILKNRSYRRFYQDVVIERDTLLDLVDLARFTSSARNLQPLRFLIVNQTEQNKKVFECLAWAGYLKDWNGPEEGEQPSAYIIVLEDNNLNTNFYCDHGLATQSITLGAVEKGFGCCIVASVRHEKLRNHFQIPENLQIIHVIAIGKPKEVVVIEDVAEDGNIRYWRDEKQVHHVPKRKLEDLVIEVQISKKLNF